MSVSRSAPRVYKPSMPVGAGRLALLRPDDTTADRAQPPAPLPTPGTRAKPSGAEHAKPLVEMGSLGRRPARSGQLLPGTAGRDPGICALAKVVQLL